MSTGASIRSALKAGVIGALLGALVAALAVALWEAHLLIASGAGARVLLAPAATAFVVATGGALIAAGLALVSRSVLALLDRLGVDWVLMLIAIATSTFTVLAAQAAVLVVLSGAGIRTAVIALSAAVGVALGAALTLGLRALAARLRLEASIALRTIAFVLGSVVTVTLTVYLAPGLIEELDVPFLLALGLPIVTGATVALIGVERRGLVRATAATWLVLGACAIAHMTLYAAPGVRRYVKREARTSHVVLNALRTSMQKPLPPMPLGSGTCKPGVAPGVLKGKAAIAAVGAPDIVVVTSDSVRWDHTSLGGYKRDTTPHLKRWAKNAAVFSAAYTPASSTRQTFRALWTGLFPSLVLPSTGKVWWGVSLPPRQVSLADRLKHAGYRTASSTLARMGFEKGSALKGFDAMLPKVSREGRAGDANQRVVRAQFDNMLNELRAERTRPVFTWAHLMVTHQPYELPTKNGYGATEMDAYDWAIKYVDGEMNRLLSALEKEGRLERTVVIFSADHGQAFFEHGNKLHGHTVYQEETHVPLIVWGPGVQAGVRSEPISTIDIVPTMLELGGAATGRELCGTTLMPSLRDASVKAGRPVYIEQLADGRGTFAIAYIKGRHKLMVSPVDRVRELFDIAADPNEQNDLVQDKEELVEQLVQELAKFQRARGMDPKVYSLP